MNQLTDFDFNQKRALVRVDFNVPLDDGRLVNDFKIKAALPTIKYLLERQAKIILLTHLGRPNGQVVEGLKVDPIAKQLFQLINQPIRKLNDCLGQEIEESIKFVEYDKDRVIRAEKMGFTNTAAHAQLTRIFQDAIVAFSNERTLNEIIERASDGKPRIAKMMRRDLGIKKIDFAEEKKQYHYEKNLMLFNRLLDVL